MADIKNRILKLEAAAGINISNAAFYSEATQRFYDKAAAMVESNIARIKDSSTRHKPYTHESPITLTAEIVSYHVLGKEPPGELVTALEAMNTARGISEKTAITLYAAIYKAANIISEKNI